MMGAWFRRLSDAESPGSFSNRMRDRRFQHFKQFIEDLPRPVSILDVGGTGDFWDKRGWAQRDDVHITTLNLRAEPQKFNSVVPVVGDATNLEAYASQSVDVVFSNSVIEHVYTKDNQKAMADEVQRVGSRYWIQTPNYWFPIEPHFQVPIWQWMPRDLRIWLLTKRQFGRRGPCSSYDEAADLVDEVRLMTRRELREMFPKAEITPEMFMGLVKSWIISGYSSGS